MGIGYQRRKRLEYISFSTSLITYASLYGIMRKRVNHTDFGHKEIIVQQYYIELSRVRVGGIPQNILLDNFPARIHEMHVLVDSRSIVSAGPGKTYM